MKKLFLIFPLVLLSGCEKPIEPINYDIVSIQPFYTTFKDRCSDDTKIGFPDGITYETDILIAGANNLAASLKNVSYKEDNKFIDQVINQAMLSKLGKNQIILIQSHGEYIDEYLHETILTGADYDESKVQQEDEDRIVESNMWNQKTYNNYEAITFEYIKAYCPDISGSIVYMGQCFGGIDWALATSFLDKGAVAVYGASDAIQMHYGDMMQYKVTSLLGEINPSTEKYYTTGEALKKAQELYGIDDKVKYDGGANGARVLLYGDPNFRLANK